MRPEFVVVTIGAASIFLFGKWLHLPKTSLRSWTFDSWQGLLGLLSGARGHRQRADGTTTWCEGKFLPFLLGAAVFSVLLALM
ncbi:MAG: hypothetical protein DMG60_10195 [Acidobacteria bacterium]|nr:MAG: hypothetical protein DMG60_10195 [Acidobacteriota bacterium]